jgi:hypothetical protein
MRSLTIFTAVLFIVGGAYAVLNPHAAIVPHQSFRFVATTAEYVSPKVSVAYGLIAIGIGVAVLYCGWRWPKWLQDSKRRVRRRNANPSGSRPGNPKMEDVPNQALEPTRTTVTPLAGAGDRASGAPGSP